MPTFGARSRRELATAHPALQRLFTEVIKERDCAVLEGHRSLERQAELFAAGATKKKSGGKHNTSPSQAVDVVPWFDGEPHIRWDDTKAFHDFARFVLGKAQELGIRIRWGGDWDQDGDTKDERFVDLVHFEVLGV